ncbi:hypothetical protein [Thiorhodovibrio frisius]|uniref:hypothetical protein n=1 Tax=Thiorhodovibrio frisius TaxID=631362 RepID=UPI001CBA8C7D|nr:hypothetical protein [Thiorhodovibrio frisius]
MREAKTTRRYADKLVGVTVRLRRARALGRAGSQRQCLCPGGHGADPRQGHRRRRDTETLEAEFRQELYAYEEQYEMPYVTTDERAGIEKGKTLGLQQGEATILMMQLEEKFGSDLLEAHRERVVAADSEELLQWSKRILTAETPETIFH